MNLVDRHDQFDICVIGAGLVGLATAYQVLLRYPGKHVLVVEKEAEVARHQSSHNSGVIHSGLYYVPGSLKALNCISGRQLLESFAQQHKIPFERCGKVVVAAEQTEIPALEKLYQKGLANGVICKRISRSELKEREPYVTAVAALLVEETGIIDFSAVAQTLRTEIGLLGGKIITEFTLQKVRLCKDFYELSAQNGAQVTTKILVNCAGLYSDKIAELCGVKSPIQIVPFRGEYYYLSQNAKRFCKHLIYPVPDARFPFLGVHLTRTIHGEVDCGPNAVLGFAREGYSNSTINIPEFSETLRFPGFWRFAQTHWKTGLSEFKRSFSKKAFLSAVQRLVPEIREADFASKTAGVRAQAMHRNGKLEDDFLIVQAHRMIHVLNAPSPAATSCLSIGNTVTDLLKQHLSE